MEDDLRLLIFLFYLAVALCEMTMDVSKSEPNKSGSTPQECAGCGKAITERYDVLFIIIISIASDY